MLTALQIVHLLKISTSSASIQNTLAGYCNTSHSVQSFPTLTINYASSYKIEKLRYVNALWATVALQYL
jgi:hypothetical protein